MESIRPKVIEQYMYKDKDTNEQPSTKSISTNNTRYPKHFDYIVSYINVGYWGCFIPFRFKYNDVKEEYEIVQCQIQKKLTIAFHIYYVSYSMLCHGYAFIQYKSSADKNPFQFFKLLESSIEMLFLFVFSRTLTCVNQFREYLELVQVRHKNGVRPKRITTINCYILPLGIIAIMSVGTWLSLTKEGNGWKIIPLMSYLNETAVSPSLNIANGAGTYESHIMLALRIIFCYARSVGESASILLFGFGWYLKSTCEDLKTFIDNDAKSFKEIMDRYLHIQHINDLTNSLLSSVVLLFVVGSIPFISEELMDFNLSQLQNVVNILYTGSNFLISMLGSAEANNMANQLKCSVLRRSHKIDRSLSNNDANEIVQMSMLFSELSSPDVGLKGMKFFTLTYGFVGVMLAQCIVYALIFIQLKSG